MTASAVPERAKQGADIRAEWTWMEASIWTERRVSALVNGVERGQWYSLIATLVQCFLCHCRAVRLIPSMAARETLPMRKSPTG